MRVPRKKIAALVRFVVRQQCASISEVDVAVVSRGEMVRLNRRWLRRGGATDVISFDLSAPGPRGNVVQVVVCGDVAASQARRRGGGAGRELMLYVVHGLLHLTGLDDHSAGDAARMRARQEELLDGFARKYRRR